MRLDRLFHPLPIESSISARCRGCSWYTSTVAEGQRTMVEHIPFCAAPLMGQSWFLHLRLRRCLRNYYAGVHQKATEHRQLCPSRTGITLYIYSFAFSFANFLACCKCFHASFPIGCLCVALSLAFALLACLTAHRAAMP